MKYNLKLSLTEREIELLRNSTSDLGNGESAAVSLQLKIANAIINSVYNAQKEEQRD